MHLQEPFQHLPLSPHSPFTLLGAASPSALALCGSCGRADTWTATQSLEGHEPTPLPGSAPAPEGPNPPLSRIPMSRGQGQGTDHHLGQPCCAPEGPRGVTSLGPSAPSQGGSAWGDGFGGANGPDGAGSLPCRKSWARKGPCVPFPELLVATPQCFALQRVCCPPPAWGTVLAPAGFVLLTPFPWQGWKIQPVPTDTVQGFTCSAGLGGPCSPLWDHSKHPQGLAWGSPHPQDTSGCSSGQEREGLSSEALQLCWDK